MKHNTIQVFSPYNCKQRTHDKWSALVLFVVFLLPTLLFPLHLQQHYEANIEATEGCTTEISVTNTTEADANFAIAKVSHHKMQHTHCALCDQYLHQTFLEASTWSATILTAFEPHTAPQHARLLVGRAHVWTQNKSPPFV
jgi:hypothetical protein